MLTPAYAALARDRTLAPHAIPRREPRDRDVEFDVLFCGVCHSDIHTARGEWTGSRYPCVPGHEVVGRVTRVGSAVTRFRVGDTAGVGCLVGSCRNCASCHASTHRSSAPTFGNELGSSCRVARSGGACGSKVLPLIFFASPT